MKKRNRFLIVGLGIMTTVLFLAGCMDNNYYSKVSEILTIQNSMDSPIYVEYGFLKSINPYNRRVTDSIPKYKSSWFRFDDSMITSIWMSEKDFNKYVSKIRIFRLTNGDSIFVAPQYYNTKSAWNYYFYNPENQSYNFKENRNDLIIRAEMFNK